MAAAPAMADAIRAFRRDLNAILSRAVWQVFGIAAARYRRTLEVRGVLDFSELLVRAQTLLGNMDEFARSRYLLEARYHHVLVDEFQDTVARPVGTGLAARAGVGGGPGPGVGRAASARRSSSSATASSRSTASATPTWPCSTTRRWKSARCGPTAHPLRSITRSFRSVPALLAFVNDLFGEIAAGGEDRRDAFSYGERDAFPVEEGAGGPPEDPPLGLVAADDVRQSAEAVAAEIARLACGAQVRDKQTGVAPADPARPTSPSCSGPAPATASSRRRSRRAGIPVLRLQRPRLLRRRRSQGHRGAAPVPRRAVLGPARGGVPALARGPPVRSRPAAPRARPGRRADGPQRAAGRGAAGRGRRGACWRACARASRTWLDLADRIPPAELLDRVLADSAYAHEIRGGRAVAARENLKKIRSLVRRLQNSGYLTLARLADHLDRLSAGDESNAVIDAVDAVNLMTVHAAKGLEFPVVFVVNLARGSGGPRAPIRIAADADPEDAVAVGDFEAEFDADQSARELEETKRLIYVALTRARDRVYLASATERGVFKPKKGSLGEVLPASMRGALGVASSAADGQDVIWAAGSGAAHAFRVCASTALPEPGARPPFAPAPGGAPSKPQLPADDFDPIVDDAGRERQPITRPGTARQRQGDAASPGAQDASAVVLGRVVHRLFQAEVRGDLARRRVVGDCPRVRHGRGGLDRWRSRITWR